MPQPVVNLMSQQGGNPLQSIQFERKDAQDKKGSQSLAPLTQKQRTEQPSKNLIFFEKKRRFFLINKISNFFVCFFFAL